MQSIKKIIKQEFLDHYEEANQNSFFQFVHYGTTLMNKEKHQAFAMHFEDNKFRHDDAIALSFRITFSHKAGKVAELAEEVCHECFGLNFTNVFSSSVQEVAISTASKELNIDKVEFDVCQGDEVGAITIGKITRTKDEVKSQFIPVDHNSQCLHLSIIDFISLLLGCDKSFS